MKSYTSEEIIKICKDQKITTDGQDEYDNGWNWALHMLINMFKE